MPLMKMTAGQFRAARAFLVVGVLLLITACGIVLLLISVYSSDKEYELAPLTPVQTSPETVREALIALFNATDGENWSDNDGWLSDAPIGEWSGVTTDGDGRVIALSLRDNQLNGEMPPELGNLANLQVLDLSDNSDEKLVLEVSDQDKDKTLLTGYHSRMILVADGLRGGIPPEMDNLTNLQELNLYWNDLRGEIPPELGNLANLQELNLSFNKLSGEIPLELNKLANLKVLNLGANSLKGEIPPELNKLANLKVLQLYGNLLSGEIPPELGNLVTLKKMHLSGNALSGEIPPELGNLGNLEELRLSGMDHSRDSNQNGLSGEIPPELGNLVTLKKMDLDGNALSGEIPPELGNLANLEELRLHNNELSGEIPPELGNLAKLKMLGLSYNRDLSGCVPAVLDRPFFQFSQGYPDYWDFCE